MRSVHVRHNRTRTMWSYLIGGMLTLWLPALGYGLPSELGLTSRPSASLGPAVSKSEILNKEVYQIPNKNLDDTIPSNSEVMPNFQTTLSPEQSATEVLSTSGSSSQVKAVFGRRARDTIAYGEDVDGLKSNKTPSTLKTYRSSHVINKCCPKGEHIIQGICGPLPEASNISDPWWWIAPSQREHLLLDTLTDSQVVYGRKPCHRSMWQILFFGKSNVTLHHRMDGIRLESTVESKDAESTHEFTYDSFCLDVGPRGQHFTILCPCTELICLRKCCNFTEEFDPALKVCVPAGEDRDEWAPAFDDDWEIDQKYLTLTRPPRCADYEKPFMQSNLDLVLMSNGSVRSNVTGAIYPRDSFCADLTPTGIETVLICNISMMPHEFAMSLAMGVLLSVGSFALLLTVSISCALPEMRKRLHGRMALMHNSMLLVAYVCTGALYLIGLRYSISVAASKVISFVIQFSFLSAFFWLNVMCIDIAMVFRGWRLVQGTAMQQESKKFFYYSVYAWGSVCLISVATAIAEFAPGARPRPAFGENRYFFNNDAAMLLFFYGPMAILLVANVILFIFTAIKIKMAAQESRMVLNCADSRTTKKNKYRLAVYAKLSTLMGITWVFEVLSWAIGGDPKVWFFLDVANLLRAVFIFIIFCCNKHVYQQLKLRVQAFFSRRPSRSSAGTQRSSGVTGSTKLEKGSVNSKKSLVLLLNSDKGMGGKLEESKKPSRCNLKEFVRPSSQTVLDAEQQLNLKDTQL